MTTFFNKILGSTLLFAAIIGIVLSIGGIIFTVRVEPQVSKSVVSFLDVLDGTLAATQKGLSMADTALGETTSALGSIQSTVDSLGQVADNVQPTLDSISSLLGTKLPDAIRTTRNALTSAETAARNVDGFLTTLSKIPVIGTVIYNPETPLNQTIGDISESLKDTPEMLSNSQTSVDQMSSNLGSIQTDIDNVSSKLNEIKTSVEDARQVVQDYQKNVDNLQKEVDRLQQKAPLWIRLASYAGILLFVWLALAQIGLALQGLERMGIHIHRSGSSPAA